MKRKRFMTALVAASLVLSLAGTATAANPNGAPSAGGPEQAPQADNLTHPRGEKQSAMKDVAVQKVLKGEATATGKNKVVKIAKGQYVELARQGEDSILTILGEFGPDKATNHPASHGDHGGGPGPMHNTIPEPDRTVDNTNIWAPDFSEAYYEDLLFGEEKGAVTMRNFYIEQSSGQYAVNGDVSPWVQVPYNGPSYGSNYCGGIVCQDTWRFVNDSADAFAATFADTAALNAYLAPFDVWDRYDYDGDGNFDEPDGYIDHFQSVHAGSGEETGGGALGSDAIWSHRWYAYFSANGPDGPGSDLAPFGGLRIGDSDYWIGDYTVEPEDGGLGVFAHEFGHDLGLPDLYDTSGNTGGAENSTGFWTLYSSGSYGSTGMPADGIGSKPIPLGNWERFQLGWLNYEVAFAGSKSSHRMGPAFHNSKQAQGVFIVLPDREVAVNLGSPYEGSAYYYSGSGNDLDNSMTRSVTLPASGDLVLDAKVRYAIELDWDYAYLTVNGTSVLTNLSTDDNPNSQNFGHGITGNSGGAWVALTADLSAYAGQTVDIGFRYWTDGAAVESGLQVDAIEIPGQPLDGAEADAGWAFDGFRTTTGTETQSFFNAYVLENRQYLGYDMGLRTGPYNFGFTSTAPDWVEHFSYRSGLLVSYWNSQYSDNNVGDHPGEGLLLPIDAHPTLTHWADGTLMRPRIQSFDSTFGLTDVPALTLHNDGVASTIPASKAVPVFTDSVNPWQDCDQHGCTGAHPGRYQPGWNTVDIPDTGTTVRVKSVSSTGFMQIDINK
ncbi:MAG: immune inhibitor A [Chloroflexota bacterium]|nr:immune inhibitor A [Chloroflexota bacterium]MDH5243585.1 immune inhibitor A [Chloroflexota bacterium]